MTENKVWTRLQAAAVAGGLAWMAWALLSLLQSSLGHLNSDTLYSEALYQTLSQGGLRQLAGWVYQPAPSFFPDFLLYFLFRSSGLPPGPAYSLFGFCHFALLLSLIHAIAISGSRKGQPLVPGLLSGAILLALLASCPELGDFFYPGFHTGTLLTGFFMAWLILPRQGPRRTWDLPLLFLASFAGSFSDRILVPQFILPLLLALGILAWRDQVSRKQALARILVMAAGTACGLSLLFYGFRPDSRWGEIPQRDYLRAFWLEPRSWAARLGALPDILLHFPALVPLTAWAVWGALSAWFSREASARARLIGLFFLFSLAGTLANGLLLADEGNARYFLPVFVLGAAAPLWLFFLPRLEQGIFPRFHAFLLAAFVLTAVLVHPLPRPGRQGFQTPYPPKVAWLDQEFRRHGIVRGYGDYWNAKWTSLLSRQGIILCPLQPDGEEFLRLQFWIDTVRRYVGDSLGWPKYEAILLDGLPEKTVLAMFGPPAEESRMPGSSSRLWFYDRAQDLRFRNFLRQDWDLRAAVIVDPALMTGRPAARRSRASLSTGVALPGGKMLFLKLKGLSHDDVLEAWADAPAGFKAAFYREMKLVGDIDIPPVPGHDLQPRFLKLPARVSRGGYDLVVFGNPARSGERGLGRCLLYSDSLH